MHLNRSSSNVSPKVQVGVADAVRPLNFCHQRKENGKLLKRIQLFEEGNVSVKEARGIEN